MAAFQSDAFQNDAFFTDGVTPTPTPQRPQVGGRSRGRARRERILARFNGEIVELDSVEQLLELIRSIKEDVQQIAEEKAVEIIKTSKKVSEARKQEKKSVEIVEAPLEAKQVLEDRVRELDRYYWLLVNEAVKRVLDEEDEILLLG